MIRPQVGDVASVALGVLAGIIAWAATGVALMAGGLGPYAVNTALPVALAMTAVTGPALAWWSRSRAPHRLRQRTGILLGALGFLVYASIAVVLVVPETILFLD